VSLTVLFGPFEAKPVAAAVPTGFEDTLLATVANPTALAFTPDGRLLLTNKIGRIGVWTEGNPLATVLDISGKTCSDGERGLLGIAVDPNFATNRAIFVFYTFKKAGNCDTLSASGPVNRVARFTLPDQGSIDPTTEAVLIDNVPSWAGNHNAGDLAFGKDGLLYVTTGDGGCDYAGGGCGGTNDASRDQHVLLGKILRITRDGGIPAANPYRGAASARCNVTGRTDPGKRCQETFASGLRNPFRFAFDPNASTTRFYINDVGQNVWEEIDLGQAGADYGWNLREGACGNGLRTNCAPPPPGLTDPIYAYDHMTGCKSITGGAFVPKGIWPTAYDGRYLFGDWVCGKLLELVPVTGGYTSREFATAPGVVHMTFGPHRGGQALYYSSLASPSHQLRRIAYVGSANRSPTAVVSASPTSGPVPLTTRFDGSASSDPDGDSLTYEWWFGDRTASSTEVSPTHSYTAAGTYTATLFVRDGRGGVGSKTIRIDAGNRPPNPKIEAPAATKLFAVGESITLTGSATDPEDGTLPASSLTWTVVLHHDTHTHPFLSPTTGNNISFKAPAPEDLAAAANSHLAIHLTAKDSKGLTTTIVQELRPRRVDLRFVTEPPGLTIRAAEQQLTGPQTVSSWQGWTIPVAAATQADQEGNVWSFSSWSDGGAASHTITTPAATATYTAAFRAAMGGVFSDGFESGDLSRWSWPQGLVVQREHVDAGAYSARATTAGAPAFAGRYLSSARPDLFYRFRFKLIRRGSGSPVRLARVRAEDNASIATLSVSDTGVLNVRNDVAGLTRNSAQAVSLGVWHTITWRIKVDAGASQIEVWYNGTRLPSLSRAEGLGSAPSRRLRLGDEETGHDFDVALDSVLID